MIDLVVFGRAAAKRAAELVKPGTPHEEISETETEKCLDRFDKIRNAKVILEQQNLDYQCKKQCNQNVQFLELKKLLKEGVEEIRKTYDGLGVYISKR